MNKDERRKDGGEEEFRWDPDWDFMDADEISKIVGESAEEEGRMKEFLSAIDDLTESDEDGRMPEESREVLEPIFDKVFHQIEEERRIFADGNILLNLRQYKRFCEGVAFAKDLKERGLILGFTPKFIKGKVPSELIFTFSSLCLTKDDRKKFADMLDGACTFRLGGGEESPVTASVRFPNMWLPVTV